jgi:hypothetical protein
MLTGRARRQAKRRHAGRCEQQRASHKYLL